MKKNVVPADRLTRVVLAIVFAILYATGTVGGTLGIVLLIAGIVFLLTGLIGYCPIYTILGIGKRSTAKN